MPHEENIEETEEERAARELKETLASLIDQEVRPRAGRVTKRYTTGGPRGHMQGTLGEALTPYRRIGKHLDAYASAMYLSGIADGEPDPSDYWELVDLLIENNVLERHQTKNWILDNWIEPNYNTIRGMIRSREESSGLLSDKAQQADSDILNLRSGKTRRRSVTGRRFPDDPRTPGPVLGI